MVITGIAGTVAHKRRSICVIALRQATCTSTYSERRFPGRARSCSGLLHNRSSWRIRTFIKGCLPQVSRQPWSLDRRPVRVARSRDTFFSSFSTPDTGRILRILTFYLERLSALAIANAASELTFIFRHDIQARAGA